MFTIKIIWAGLIATTTCLALSVSGMVSDISGEPIAGATVKLEINGQSVQSGIDGKFTLNTVTIKDYSPQSKPLWSNIRIIHGFLLVNLPKQSNVEVVVYNLHGRVISTMRNVLNAGMNSITLPCYASGVYIYKIKCDNTEIMLQKNVFDSNPQGQFVSEISGSSNNVIAKQAKVTSYINDVISVTKDGYLNYRCVLYNDDTTGVEIKMIVCADTVRDIDGNLYHAVRIGNQVWTVENLRTTKYNDSTDIPSDENWYVTTPNYCFYKNTTNQDSINKYGAIYNWYVLDPSNPKSITPTGWHVPTDAEWDTLQNYLITNGYNWDTSTTDNKIAKSLAAKTDWERMEDFGCVGCELTKNNTSGFSAIPGGYRSDSGFWGQGSTGYWWSVTSTDSRIASSRVIFTEHDDLQMTGAVKSFGFCIRLIKDQ